MADAVADAGARTQNDAEEGTEGQEESLSLTPREEALAKGQDPDAVESDATEDSSEGGTGQDGEVPDQEGSGDPGGGKDAASLPEGESWLTDDVLALAESYGLDREGLERFSSESDFRAAASFLDSRLQPKDDTLSDTPETSATPATPAETPAEKEPSAPDEKPLAKLDRAKFEEEGFDEATLLLVDAHNRLVDDQEAFAKTQETLTAQLQEYRDAEARRQAIDQMEAFHDSVDALDPDRYGRSLDGDGKWVELSKEHDNNRRKLHESLRVIVSGLKSTAKDEDLPPLKVLLDRAEMLAFGDSIRAAERGKIKEQVRAQSKKRRQAASRTTAKAPAMPEHFDDPDAYVASIANHPDLKRFWEESGNDK